VIANTLSGVIRIPKTNTAAKTAVKTRIKPSLTSSLLMKNRMTIGNTGNTLDAIVIIPLAIQSCEEFVRE